MNYPSIKTIESRLSVDRTTAKFIRLAMQNQNKRIYRRMQEIDFLLETYGVEYTADKNDTHISSFGIEYCNTGDTYANTVLYDWSKQRFSIGSWGDIVEKNPKRFG